MKSKSLAPRERFFPKSRSRRREEADGYGLSPTPAPHVRDYHLSAYQSGNAATRRILLRLAPFVTLLGTQL